MLCAHVSCIVAAENLELELVEEMQGVVGSAETGSPSWGTLASLREASTTPHVYSKNISREEKGIV